MRETRVQSRTLLIIESVYIVRQNDCSCSLDAEEDVPNPLSSRLVSLLRLNLFSSYLNDVIDRVLSFRAPECDSMAPATNNPLG